MRKASLVVAALALVGCAKAAIGPDDDSSDDQSDSNDSDADTTDDSIPIDSRPPIDSPPPIDAPAPDAAPIAITLSQTVSTVENNLSIACGTGLNGYTRSNSWFRVFDLTQAGVTGPLTVSAVSFGVETATGAQTVDVKLGTYMGAVGGNILDTALITPITQQTVAVTATSLAVQTVPMTASVPAGSKLVVEIFAPDHNGTTTSFYLGTTSAAESTAGYLMSSACGLSQPQSLRQIQASLDPPATPSSVIITVDGVY
jgi:hypothetical protein